MEELKWKYIKPLENKLSIKEVEKKYNIQIPNDIETCIIKNNGGRPNLKVYDTEKSKERVFKTLLSYNTEDIENVYKVLEVFKKENIELLPIASDPGGNFICSDFKENNKIVLWIHETGKKEYVAESFAKFLTKLYEI